MRKKDFENLVESIKQMKAIRAGKMKPGRVFRYDPVEVRNIRRQFKQSQREFALMIGVSVDTLQNWEQSRRVPVGPARALLTVAAKNPKAVFEALHG